MSAMFNQVPQPLRYAEALLGRFAGLARAANADSLLGGLVETAAQLEQLKRFGAHQIQGYLVSRPLPLAELAVFMRGERRAGLAH